MCTVLLLTVQMSLFTSCNDDLAADSYYTFTGEMMSDFFEESRRFQPVQAYCRACRRDGFSVESWLPDFLSGRQFRSGIIFERNVVTLRSRIFRSNCAIRW